YAPMARDHGVHMHGKRAGVVGAGTMGAAIAEVLAFNGIAVALKDLNGSLVEKGLARVRHHVDELVRFHAERAEKEIARIQGLGVTLTPEQTAAIQAKLAPKVGRQRGDEIVGRVHGTTTWEPFGDVDFVVEAAFEKIEIKREIFEALDAVLPAHAILGSNTSSLSITRLARGLRHTPQILVTHFFNPPVTLPLVEVAGGLDTREDVITETIEFLQGLRNHRYPLVPIRVQEAPGFVVNRLLIPVMAEACFALQEGLASARDIDQAMKAGAGMPMGPFELADLVGLDVTLDVMDTLYREFQDSRYRAPPMLRRLVDAGHLGRKTGRGFYEYT
ncbi:MAG TPA: 3-hydroxyacyl-CoA dehydrogenase NAD-binding domain-containing protein, partial [Thermoplasmata archaeon]|nr:3-hydroxyacyl-CoA dehydrogenase NAD-binding domain-containing protein [Thermoplasmata archaeon]